MKNGVQRFGKFLSAMIMPNIGALIAFGFLAAFFNGSGWLPHEGFATIFSAILVYLIPILIASTGGKLIGGDRGSVVASIAVVGAIMSDPDTTMLMAAMIMESNSADLLCIPYSVRFEPARLTGLSAHPAINFPLWYGRQIIRTLIFLSGTAVR